MSDFTTVVSGFRYVQTQFGDTLQAVAYRELGDATQWATLAWLNELITPYLTDDKASVVDGVLLTGSTLKVPSVSASVDASTASDDVFFTDIALVNGRLQFENGNIATVSGQANLAQAISNRIGTDHGDLIFHGSYGANLRRLIGALAGPVCAVVAAEYVSDALQQETRIQTINNVTVVTTGDTLNVTAEVVPIAGANINVTRAV